jgi:hypothetical protein
MFKSKPFMDDVSHLKTILSEGILSLSVSGATEECRILKSLVLGDFTKSKWVECYEQIKVCFNPFDTGSYQLQIPGLNGSVSFSNVLFLDAEKTLRVDTVLNGNVEARLMLV